MVFSTRQISRLSAFTHTDKLAYMRFKYYLHLWQTTGKIPHVKVSVLVPEGSCDKLERDMLNVIMLQLLIKESNLDLKIAMTSCTSHQKVSL